MSSGQTPTDKAAKAIAQHVRLALRRDQALNAAVQRLNDWIRADRCDSEDPIMLCVDLLEYMGDSVMTTLAGVLGYLAEAGWELPTPEELEGLKPCLLDMDWEGVEAWFDQQFPE